MQAGMFLTERVCLSLQVFLSVRPPGPAHEEAHLRSKRRSGREERARGERRRRRGRRDRKRESEGWAVELSAHLIHPVYKPVGGHDACRATHPYERAIISNTLAALSVETGIGGQ